MDTTADTIVLVLVWVCAIPSNLYPIFYLWRPWTTTPQGRALMVKAWGNLILVDMIWARHVFGDYPFRWLVLIVGFTLFAAGIWYLFIAMLRSRGARDYPPYTWLAKVRGGGGEWV